MKSLVAIASVGLLALNPALSRAQGLAEGAPSSGHAAAVSVRVEGPGFLRLVREGRVVLVREAWLTASKGRLASERGLAVLPTILVPCNATSLQIDPSGNLQATVGGGAAPLGRLSLAVFDAPPSGPTPDGYYTSALRPKLVWPGDPGAGTIVSASVRVYPATGPDVSNARGAQSAQLPVAPLVKGALAKTPPNAPATRGSGQAEKAGDGRPTINVRILSEVSGSQFTLGEIAEIKADPQTAARLAAVVAGDTPALGVDRLLEHARLASRLRMAGFEPLQLNLNLPSGAKVQRQCQRATHDQLVEAAIIGAEAKLGAGGTLVSKQPGIDLILPLGELRLVCESATETDAGVRATVAAYVSGRRVNSRVVQLERTGVGPALKIGQTVKVRVRSAGAMIETTGRVSRSSRRGEPVEVLTSDGVTLSGTATPDGAVEVEL